MNITLNQPTNIAQDFVFIEDLIVFSTIGVYDFERQIKQKLIFDLVFKIDNSEAAKCDDVKKCLNYAEVCSEIEQFCQNNEFYLVETLAQNLYLNLKNKFIFDGVELKITKENAIDNARVGVKIIR